jgi:hypothetical protein
LYDLGETDGRRFSRWAALPGNLSILLVAAIACFGFYAARAGQPLFGKFE